MTVHVVQAASAAYDGSITPVAVSLGSLPTNGNLLVVVYSTFGTQPTTPTGWTNSFWELSGGDSFGVYTKTAASDPVNPFSVASTNNCAMSIWEVAGSTGFVDVAHATGSSGAGPFTTPTNTTSTSFSLMLQALHIRDTSAPPLNAPSSAGAWTSDATATSATAFRTASIGHQAVSGSGTVVSPDFTVPDANYDRGAIAVIEISGSGSSSVSISAALPTITVAGGTWAVAANTGASIAAAYPAITVAGGAWGVTTTGRPGPSLSNAGRGVVPNTKVRGIRSPITQGTLLGRSATGTGDVQILKPVDLGLATKTDVQAVAAAAVSGGIAGLALVATTGQYGDLLSLPVISTVGHTGAYADLTGKPSLAAVATSGSASDLTTGTLAAARLPAFTGGDVTSSIGTVNLVIGANKVTLAQMAQITTASILGRNTASTGNVEVLSAATLRSILGLATVATSGLASDLTGTLAVAQLPALTGGDVTSSVSSGNLAIGTNKVTLAQMAQIATQSFLGRNTASTGNVEVLSAATVRTILGLATVATSGSATDLTTGTLAVARLSAFTGDVTSPGGNGILTIAPGAVTGADLAAGAAATNLGFTPRQKLTANTTYFVRTDGNDSNTGLVNSAGGAFLTIQKAINTVRAIDISTFTVTIQVAAGTYTGAVVASGAWVGQGAVVLQGDTTTPSNVLLSGTSINMISIQNRAVLTVQGFKLTTATAGSCLILSTQGVCTFNNIEFGAAAATHISVATGASITANGPFSCSGGAAAYFLFCTTNSIIDIHGQTLTFTGTPSFPSAFCGVITSAVCRADTMTFVPATGAFTGARYDLRSNGVLDVNGAATTYFPGSAVGSIVSGGQYV